MEKEKCEACGRPKPTLHNKPPEKRQTRFSVAEPIGEGGLLDELLEQIVEKYQPLWADELGDIGSKAWRYRALHFALYMVATEPALVPSEV